MATGSTEGTGRRTPDALRRQSLDEQVRRLGLRPVASADEMAREDVFDSDEEIDAFLSHVYAERHANLA